ncbi:unnamed protein product, partial [Laminaria digitata]
LYLFTYAVDVTEEGGKSRLRRVARACESRGNRVQQSVFECVLDDKEFEILRARLLEIINTELDTLRIYTIGSREDYVEAHGLDHTVDFTAPLVF